MNKIRFNSVPNQSKQLKLHKLTNLNKTDDVISLFESRLNTLENAKYMNRHNINQYELKFKPKITNDDINWEWDQF